MTFSLLFAIAVVSFLLLVSVVTLLLWHSYPSGNILGGLLVMWVMITIFLAIVYFTEKKSPVAETAKNAPDKSFPSASGNL